MRSTTNWSQGGAPGRPRPFNRSLRTVWEPGGTFMSRVSWSVGTLTEAPRAAPQGGHRKAEEDVACLNLKQPVWLEVDCQIKIARRSPRAEPGPP